MPLPSVGVDFTFAQLLLLVQTAAIIVTGIAVIWKIGIWVGRFEVKIGHLEIRLLEGIQVMNDKHEDHYNATNRLDKQVSRIEGRLNGKHP